MKYRAVYVDQSAVHPLRDGWACGVAVAINVEAYLVVDHATPGGWSIEAIYVEAHTLDDEGTKDWCWVEISAHDPGTDDLYSKIAAYLCGAENEVITEKMTALPSTHPHASRKALPVPSTNS